LNNELTKDILTKVEAYVIGIVYFTYYLYLHYI